MTSIGSFWPRGFSGGPKRALHAVLTMALMAVLVLAGPAAEARAKKKPKPDPAFVAWKAEFTKKAKAQGYEARWIDQLLKGAKPDPRVLERFEKQAEFTRPIWDYLDRAVSPTRLDRVKAESAARADALARIEAQYGVDAAFVLAIWGLESNFGEGQGEFDAAFALATLASKTRRQDFAEEQLLALLEMLRRGDAKRAELKGSWAGAMGQVQFIPSTYLARAVDWNGDGRRNIWTDSDEALASAANFLSQVGWRRGEAWGVEVRLPEGFDYSLADPFQRNVMDWSRLGLAPLDGRAFTPEEMRIAARLILPAGAQGPGFLVYPNFQAIKAYNASDSYALAVSLLADQARGRPGVIGLWPRSVTILQPPEIREMQIRLAALGHDLGPPDGLAGPRTRSALAAVQKAAGVPADGFATSEALALVRARTPQIAAPPASPG